MSCEAKHAPPWPTDDCYIDGMPYRIVDRALVTHNFTMKHPDGKVTFETCSYTACSVVPA